MATIRGIVTVLLLRGMVDQPAVPGSGALERAG
jgi:hypothetical protein